MSTNSEYSKDAGGDGGHNANTAGSSLEQSINPKQDCTQWKEGVVAITSTVAGVTRESLSLPEQDVTDASFDPSSLSTGCVGEAGFLEKSTTGERELHIHEGITAPLQNIGTQKKVLKAVSPEALNEQSNCISLSEDSHATSMKSSCNMQIKNTADSLIAETPKQPSMMNSETFEWPIYVDLDREVLLEEGYVVKPEDVICQQRGCKDSAVGHVGNERLRELVEKHCEEYANTLGRIEKSTIVRNIVDTIRSSGGRFVRASQDPSIDTPVHMLNQWYDIGNIRAREKVGHSLRSTLGRLRHLKVKNQPMKNNQILKDVSFTTRRKDNDSLNSASSLASYDDKTVTQKASIGLPDSSIVPVAGNTDTHQMESSKSNPLDTNMDLLQNLQKLQNYQLKSEDAATVTGFGSTQQPQRKCSSVTGKSEMTNLYRSAVQLSSQDKQRMQLSLAQIMQQSQQEDKKELKKYLDHVTPSLGYIHSLSKGNSCTSFSPDHDQQDDESMEDCRLQNIQHHQQFHQQRLHAIDQLVSKKSGSNLSHISRTGHPHQQCPLQVKQIREKQELQLFQLQPTWKYKKAGVSTRIDSDDCQRPSTAHSERHLVDSQKNRSRQEIHSLLNVSQNLQSKTTELQKDYVKSLLLAETSDTALERQQNQLHRKYNEISLSLPIRNPRQQQRNQSQDEQVERPLDEQSKIGIYDNRNKDIDGEPEDGNRLPKNDVRVGVLDRLSNKSYLESQFQKQSNRESHCHKQFEPDSHVHEYNDRDSQFQRQSGRETHQESKSNMQLNQESVFQKVSDRESHIHKQSDREFQFHKQSELEFQFQDSTDRMFQFHKKKLQEASQLLLRLHPKGPMYTQKDEVDPQSYHNVSQTPSPAVSLGLENYNKMRISYQAKNPSSNGNSNDRNDHQHLNPEISKKCTTSPDSYGTGKRNVQYALRDIDEDVEDPVKALLMMNAINVCPKMTRIRQGEKRKHKEIESNTMDDVTESKQDIIQPLQPLRRSTGKSRRSINSIKRQLLLQQIESNIIALQQLRQEMITNDSDELSSSGDEQDTFHKTNQHSSVAFHTRETVAPMKSYNLGSQTAYGNKTERLCYDQDNDHLLVQTKPRTDPTSKPRLDDVEPEAVTSSGISVIERTGNNIGTPNNWSVVPVTLDGKCSSTDGFPVAMAPGENFSNSPCTQNQNDTTVVTFLDENSPNNSKTDRGMDIASNRYCTQDYVDLVQDVIRAKLSSSAAISSNNKDRVSDNNGSNNVLQQQPFIILLVPNNSMVASDHAQPVSDHKVDTIQ